MSRILIKLFSFRIKFTRVYSGAIWDPEILILYELIRCDFKNSSLFYFIIDILNFFSNVRFQIFTEYGTIFGWNFVWSLFTVENLYSTYSFRHSIYHIRGNDTVTYKKKCWIDCVFYGLSTVFSWFKAPKHFYIMGENINI